MITGGDDTGPSLWRLRLTVRTGPDTGRSCVVDRDVVTVGKLPGCDLVLSDPTVSRRHFSICRAPGGRWRVVDLGSTNGTFVDGARIQEAPIEAGRVLVAGKVEIVFLPERHRVEGAPWPEDRFGPLVGRSPSMRNLFGLLARAAPTDATVIVQGETGTGKGLVARALREASLRRAGPYVVVDCGAVSRQLVESELFGHEKGAFTGAFERRQGAFELANGGTIFIDSSASSTSVTAEVAARCNSAGASGCRSHESRHRGAIAARGRAWRVPRGSLFSSLRRRDRCAAAARERGAFRCSSSSSRRDRRAARSRPRGSTARPSIGFARLGNVRELKNAIERAVLLAAVRPGGQVEVNALARSRDSREVGRPTKEGFDRRRTRSEGALDGRTRARLCRNILEHAQNSVNRAARDADGSNTSQVDDEVRHRGVIDRGRSVVRAVRSWKRGGIASQHGAAHADRVGDAREGRPRRLGVDVDACRLLVPLAICRRSGAVPADRGDVRFVETGDVEEEGLSKQFGLPSRMRATAAKWRMSESRPTAQTLRLSVPQSPRKGSLTRVSSISNGGQMRGVPVQTKVSVLAR